MNIDDSIDCPCHNDFEYGEEHCLCCDDRYRRCCDWCRESKGLIGDQAPLATVTIYGPGGRWRDYVCANCAAKEKEMEGAA